MEVMNRFKELDLVNRVSEELGTEVPTPVFLPGESHGWRSLVGCSPWGRTELDTTETT